MKEEVNGFLGGTLIFLSACAQAQRDIIFELRRIAFDVECEPNNSGSIEKRKSMYTRDYKKLGFIVSSTRTHRTDDQSGKKESVHTG